MRVRSLPLLLSAALAALAAAGCTPMRGAAADDRRGDTNGRAFEFSSSAGDDAEGKGEWILRCRGDAFWIARAKDGRTRDYGTFQLTAAEEAKLWHLVDEATLDRLKPSRRPGRPNEVAYLFTLIRPARPMRIVEIWQGDAEEHADVVRLVSHLAGLIHKYTKKPVRL